MKRQRPGMQEVCGTWDWRFWGGDAAGELVSSADWWVRSREVSVLGCPLGSWCGAYGVRNR